MQHNIILNFEDEIQSLEGICYGIYLYANYIERTVSRCKEYHIIKYTIRALVFMVYILEDACLSCLKPRVQLSDASRLYGLYVAIAIVHRLHNKTDVMK